MLITTLKNNFSENHAFSTGAMLNIEQSLNT